MGSFDILGELAFGESFHSLESGKAHFWGDLIMEQLYLITLTDNLDELELLQPFLNTWCLRRSLCRAKTPVTAGIKFEKCLASTSSRKDFVTSLAQKVREGERLVSGIREAFASYEEINAQNAQNLPYLQAIINEGPRLCPPGSQGSPRVSLGFEIHGRTIPAGSTGSLPASRLQMQSIARSVRRSPRLVLT
ncbi:cytochrome P450 [Penicillium verhagenii]|nr:cytochrome P450 [Penicillium verhagenii]